MSKAIIIAYKFVFERVDTVNVYVSQLTLKAKKGQNECYKKVAMKLSHITYILFNNIKKKTLWKKKEHQFKFVYF